MVVESQQYRVWWDDKEEIARVFVNGEFDEKTTQELVKDCQQFVEKRGKKLDWIVNLENFPQPMRSIFSSKVRKMIAGSVSLLNDEGKIAIIGATTKIRVITNFVLKAAGLKDVKFFLIEEEALKWIKEE